MNATRATLTVPRRVESVRPATAFLVETARRLHVPPAGDSVFEVAISEAVTNAVRHGRPADESSTITCDIEVADRTLTVRIIDGGTGFDVPLREASEPSRERIEALREAGYGLPIIQTVFPIVRVVEVNGRFGLELGLTY